MPFSGVPSVLANLSFTVPLDLEGEIQIRDFVNKQNPARHGMYFDVDCDVCKKQVIHNFDKGIMHMGQMIHQVRCPLCSNSVPAAKIVRIGGTMCTITYDGFKVNGERVQGSITLPYKACFFKAVMTTYTFLQFSVTEQRGVPISRHSDMPSFFRVEGANSLKTS